MVTERVHSGGHLSSLLTPYTLAAQVLQLFQGISACVPLSISCPSSGLVYIHRRSYDTICDQTVPDNLRRECYLSFFP